MCPIELKNLEELLNKKVKTILIVEDDGTQLMSIRNMLSAEHLEVLAAGSGREACELLQSHDIDCIVLDMGLDGEMSGMDVLRKMRNEVSSRSIPVIIYTNWDLSRAQEDELLKLADSIIKKDHESQNRLFDEVTLFLHQVVSVMSESQKKILESLYDQECALEGRRILLVDDDMRNIYAMSSVLEKNGLRVSVANNGIEAIDLAMNDDHYDLIFMDIMMPKMDGHEAIKCIRKIVGYEDIPIIALTAKIMNEDREECLESGASDYLSKPIDKDIMLSLLRVWLYQRAQS